MFHLINSICQKQIKIPHKKKIVEISFHERKSIQTPFSLNLVSRSVTFTKNAIRTQIIRDLEHSSLVLFLTEPRFSSSSREKFDFGGFIRLEQPGRMGQIAGKLRFNCGRRETRVGAEGTFEGELDLRVHAETDSRVPVRTRPRIFSDFGLVLCGFPKLTFWKYLQLVTFFFFSSLGDSDRGTFWRIEPDQSLQNRKIGGGSLQDWVDARRRLRSFLLREEPSQTRHDPPILQKRVRVTEVAIELVSSFDCDEVDSSGQMRVRTSPEAPPELDVHVRRQSNRQFQGSC